MTIRTEGFRLGSLHGVDQPDTSSKEAILQRNLFSLKQMRLHKRDNSTKNINIIGYETPLKKSTRSQSIDLVGYDDDGNIYIIELKTSDNKEKIDAIVKQLNNYEMLLKDCLPYFLLELKQVVNLPNKIFGTKLIKILLAPIEFYRNRAQSNLSSKEIVYCTFDNVDDVSKIMNNCYTEPFVDIKMMDLS